MKNKIVSYIRITKRALSLWRQALYQVRDEWLGRYFLLKPIVIQLPITDICNSRCVMCNIWQRKRDKEMNAEEMRQILADQLFSKVRHVGISGGEPTLRSDLADLGRAIVESLPELSGITILTNALNSQQVIERIEALHKVCIASNVSFSVGVSLDGVGEIHNLNRGRKGNFDSAVEVIHQLKQKGMRVWCGCTLTPINCWWADDVLAWCEENNIDSWEFRLAVEINRVYNEGYGQQHPFTPEQRFHLIMFFDKLAHHSGVGESHRRFYRSLVGQLAFGLPRQSGCNWRSRGVTLDARGDISYCSVQSPILGSALERSAWQIYREGLPERQRIIREHCDSCQHDLLGPPSAKEMAREAAYMVLEPWRQQWRRLCRRFKHSVDKFQAPKSILPAEHNSPSEWQHVLITGWYGTETAGDKAILGELLHFLKTYAPGCQVTLTTIDNKVSQQTKLELAELKGITLVDMDKGHEPALIESVDAVIIGGGPLEEISQTEYIWRMFVEANRQRKARIIFGCGVGPLYSERLRQMVGAICQMTTAGFLRDEESREYAIRLGGSESLGYACDPALAYIQRWAANFPRISQENEPLRIAGLVRANTNEYIVDMDRTELKEFNAQTARQIAQIIETVCKKFQAKVDLLPMHAIWVGGDDRIFNRQVAGYFSNSDAVQVERRYLPLETLLRSIHSVDAAVAMRYHGHLFCMALGIPFLSIDYTGKPGKVHSLIQRIGYEQWSEEWRNIDVAHAASRLQRLLEERVHWSAYLQQQTDKLVAELRKTYTRVFGVPEVLL